MEEQIDWNSICNGCMFRSLLHSDVNIGHSVWYCDRGCRKCPMEEQIKASIESANDCARIAHGLQLILFVLLSLIECMLCILAIVYFCKNDDMYSVIPFGFIAIAIIFFASSVCYKCFTAEEGGVK